MHHPSLWLCPYPQRWISFWNSPSRPTPQSRYTSHRESFWPHHSSGEGKLAWADLLMNDTSWSSRPSFWSLWCSGHLHVLQKKKNDKALDLCLPEDNSVRICGFCGTMPTVITRLCLSFPLLSWSPTCRIHRQPHRPLEVPFELGRNSKVRSQA